jgi:ectoine hydroxylase-related dioxygenase (phytanoyl-CoA dioxygenase family)
MPVMHDMSTRVCSDRKAAFDAHGWLVLRSVVSERDLAELTRIFDDLMTPFATPPGEGRGVVQRPNACRTHTMVLRHLREGVAAIACDLLGARSVQLLQDTLLLKRPSAGSIALHQDYSYTAYLDRPSSLAVGLALTDATRENGCLYVVDGSHTWGLVSGLHLFADELQKDLGRGLPPAQRERVDSAKVPLEVRAGDVTIHHCLTLHGSDDNTSARPRKTVITHLFSGDCTIVRERLPRGAQQWFRTDDQGRLAAPAFPTLYPDPAAMDLAGRQRKAQESA